MWDFGAPEKDHTPSFLLLYGKCVGPSLLA